MIRKAVLGVLIGLYAWFITIINLPEAIIRYKRLSPFDIGLTLVLLGLVACCAGMFLGRSWPRRPLLILNGIYLLFGVYMLYFGWTFYIFEKPTLMQRISNLTLPLLFGILLPLLVFRFLQSKENNLMI